jgi:hypothetical protein
MKVIEESGAIEGLMKALHKRLANQGGGEEEEEEAPKKKKKRKKPEPENAEKDSESKVDKAKKGKRRKKKRKRDKEKTEKLKAIAKSNQELSTDELEEVFEEAALEKMQENPLAIMVEILKMSIEEQGKWPVIEETLTEEQFKIFKKITESEDDEEIEKLLKRLYAAKGMRRFFKLEKHLDEQQQKYIEHLVEVAAKDLCEAKG